MAVEMLNKCTTFGAKHMWKSICESRKHTRFGALLADVEKLHAAEAHLEVKMPKTKHVQTTFGGSDAEKVHATVL